MGGCGAAAIYPCRRAGVNTPSLPACLPRQMRQACRAIALRAIRAAGAAMFSLPSVCRSQTDGRCEHTPRFLHWMNSDGVLTVFPRICDMKK